VVHYYVCEFRVNRLRIDGDIRQKPLYWTDTRFGVIAIYRLRPLQLEGARESAYLRQVNFYRSNLSKNFQGAMELLAFNAQKFRGNVTLATPPFRKKF